MKIASMIPAFTTVRLVVWGIIAGLILAGGIWCYFQYRDLQNLKVANAGLVTENKDLKDDQAIFLRNFTTCAASNKQNNETIQHLLEDRTQAQKIVDELSAKQLATSDKLRTLQAKLNALDSMTSNGPIGEYLRETIRGIQQMDKQ